MADGTIYNAALAKQLFEAAHPYTENEPYGWEFVFKETGDIKKQEEITRKMELYAPVLLALVDNCGEIMWSFADDPDNAPDKPEYKVASADASKLLGADVKSYAESPERVMKLLYELGL